jgi:cyclase
MSLRYGILGFLAVTALFAGQPASAQVTEPHMRKIADGVHVYVGRHFGATCTNANCVESNAGIVITTDGVVLIDTGQSPTDSRAILEEVRKLTSLPVRYIVHTEPHPDHTFGDFLFSPPATVIAYKGAGEEMKSRPAGRAAELAKQSPEMAKAVEGYKMVMPEEFEGKKTLTVGERTFELIHLPNVHSEADLAVWLPKERALFSAAGSIAYQWNAMRPFVSLPSIIETTKIMKALQSVAVIPGHGVPGTTKILDDAEAHYALVLSRVRQMASEGKTPDQIKKDIRFPEFDNWLNKERMPQVIDAAIRASN